MEQGADTYENCEIPVLPTDIDCILLTHAHIDHSGKVPMLVSQGFTGPIYCTGATRVLCNMMLKDSAHIQESEAEWENRKNKRACRYHIRIICLADKPCVCNVVYQSDQLACDGR